LAVDVVGVLFLAYFLVALFLSLDARYPIGAALVLLGVSAVILAFEPPWEFSAEDTAVYAYYFLVIGVALRVVEFARKSDKPLAVVIWRKIKRRMF
jgi:hypothetical protein